MLVEPIIVAILGPVETDENGTPLPPHGSGDQFHNNGLEESAHAFRSTSRVAKRRGEISRCDHADSYYNSSFWPCHVSDSAGDFMDEHTDATHRRLGFLPSYVADVSSFRETSMSFATLAMLFIIMSGILLVFLSCFYHNQKTSPLFISPRRHRLPKLVPPPLPVDGAFSWIKVAFYISDEEIINRIGYDSLIFLRFHRLALRCIVKMSVFSFIVLLPLNFTGGGHANATDLKGYVGTLLFTDFLRFTMANVSGGSPRLWVHCFAAYLLTGIVVRELLVEYEAFNNIRHRYLLSKEPHLRTVLVTNIPRHLRAPSKINTYFRHVYPEAVKTVTICQNLIQLERLVAQRTAVLARIEKELLVLCRTEKQKLVGLTKFQSFKTAITSCQCLQKIGLCPGAQERLASLYSKLEELNCMVEKEQKRRRRVMQKLDTMEAGEGRKDIDYILAVPFAGEDPRQKAPRSWRNAGNNYQAYRPPTIGAPRNPDGTVALSSYTSPATNTSGATDNHSDPVAPEAEIPQVHSVANTGNHIPENTHDNVSATAGQPSGPFLRSAAPSLAGTASDAGAFVFNNTVDDVDNFETFPSQRSLRNDFDVNSKKVRRPLSKAKHAIKRYARNVRNVSFWGRPKLGNDDGFVHTPIDGSATAAMTGHIEDHTNEVCDKAFVVMRTFTASTIAIQSMHSSKPGSMEVNTAPEPRDILWENIYVSKGAKRTRSFIGETLVLLLIGFYVVPVALVSLLVSESALVSSSPRLAQLDQASAFFSSAIAMVQPLCLVGIQQLLPPLFIQISKAEGLVAFSDVQMRAFSRYFLFQVLNVFLVTTIAGSIFDTIAIIIENPEAAFEMLGNSLPRLSSFFITYVTMKTFLGLGVELVRIISLVQASLRFILFPNSTLREHRSVRIGMRAIDDPGWFPFHKVLAQDMLVVVISVVFAVVAPLVLFPCALFCLFSRIMWTHHHLYVFESVFETGGQFWPKIFRRFVFGLIIAQATITGQFILKEARHEAYATIALMFLTYFFLRRTRARYDRPSSTLPLEVATVMDISVSQEEEVLKRKLHGESRHQPSYELNMKNGGSNKGSQVRFSDPRNGSVPDSSDTGADEAQDAELGAVIGQYDPFEHAYLQPALRADPRARPEQPFPPSQLGREEVFMGSKYYNDGKGSTLGAIGEDEICDDVATVRLKSLNQQDRGLVNRWWSDQLQCAGEQNVLGVLIGEECGTLLIGKRTDLIGSEREEII